MGESRRKYDEEFKRNAVELCRTSGKTASLQKGSPFL